MIYQVCVLVATIILGVLGLELILAVRSARKVVEEAQQALKELNSHLPSILDDVQGVTNLVRDTTELVGGSVNQVAVTLEDMKRNPIHFVSSLVETLKQLMGLWNEIRGHKGT